MRRTLLLFITLGLWLVPCAQGADSTAEMLSSAPAASASGERLPGVEFAEGISQITGVAVSPMLGVSVVGAWRYYRTEEGLRAALPWFCQPVVWGCGFVMLALCFLKDSLGAVAPPLVKKPLDMVELVENKASALVASTAFVPLVAAQMAQHLGTPQAAGGAGAPVLVASAFLPVASLSVDWRLLLVPVAVLSFLIVWLTSHAINVLIALCPFGFIDAMLKVLKTGILASVATSYLINPVLGAALSVAIIAVAAWLAPLAFRFTWFGTLLAADILLPGRARRRATPETPQAFVAGGGLGPPRWTCGRLSRAADGRVSFAYRPWLLLPAREVPLPEGTLVLGKGLLFPTLKHGPGAGGRLRALAVLPPRYRGQEDLVGGHLCIADIRDGALSRGLKAAKAWIVEIIDLGRASTKKLTAGP